jgi:hypothetical protein
MKRLLCLLRGHNDVFEPITIERGGIRGDPWAGVRVRCVMQRCRKCGRRVLGLPLYGGHHVWVKVRSVG